MELSVSRRDELIALVNRAIKPWIYGIDEDGSSDAALRFCAVCPDPLQAWWLISECPDRMNGEEIVDRAFRYPVVKMADIPESKLPSNHPLRLMADRVRER